MFTCLDEPSHVFPSGHPVNRVDLLLKTLKAPFPVDLNILVLPRVSNSRGYALQMNVRMIVSPFLQMI